MRLHFHRFKDDLGVYFDGIRYWGCTRCDLTRAGERERTSADRVQAPDHPVGLWIHNAEHCEGPCAWHRPSDHHMVDWPRNIRMDRSDQLTERICPDNHVGHPDPDTMAFLEAADAIRIARGEDPIYESSGIHGCDGCCRAPHYPDLSLVMEA